MNTYLLPVSDSDGPWIEKVSAKSFSEAEAKFVKSFADDYDCVDYGGDLEDTRESLKGIGILIGDIYDIEEF